MLRAFPGVRRWEETDDIFQNAVMRMFESLKEAKFASIEEFYRFASLIIRRELIDLSRRYHGPLGLGVQHATRAQAADSLNSDRLDPDSDTHEPSRLALWTEFHEKMELLSDEERQTFDLLWYQELTQADAAKVLNISERTVQRRWQQARLKMYELLHGQLPSGI